VSTIAGQDHAIFFVLRTGCQWNALNATADNFLFALAGVLFTTAGSDAGKVR